jgi:hypothetical protein
LDDGDCDGTVDSDDNCPVDDNPSQEDSDEDLLGDACDPCPTNADCDGDGYKDGDEFPFIGTNPEDPCGQNAWPSDLVSSGFSFNKLDIVDLASFVTPVRRMNTNLWEDGFDARWDLRPGSTFGAQINVQDLSVTVTGATGGPPMFGGQRAFGRTCPLAP